LAAASTPRLILRLSLDEMAEKLHMDPSTLDRLLKFYREHEARLNRLADKLP
jgi:transcriptional regulator with XRE-family HTH domain